MTLDMHEYLDYIDDNDIDVPKEDDEDKDWLIQLDLGEEPTCFDERALHIGQFLQIPVDADDEVR
jgi:hypothetical protein